MLEIAAMRRRGQKELEQERRDGAEEDRETLRRHVRVGAARELTTQVAAESEREKRREEHALGGGLVAAGHVFEVQLGLELAKEQLDLPPHRVHLRGNGGGEREDWGAGQIESMPFQVLIPDGDEAKLEMTPGPVAFGNVAILVIDPNIEGATTHLGDHSLVAAPYPVT